MLGIAGLLISIRAASTKTLPEGAFPNDEHSGSHRSENDGVSDQEGTSVFPREFSSCQCNDPVYSPRKKINKLLLFRL